MLRGAVQISPLSVRYSVLSLGPNGPATVTAGFTEVTEGWGGPHGVETALEEGVMAARDAGAAGVDLFLAPEIKGTRLAARLSVKARRLGLRGLEFTGSGAAIAASFISRTIPLNANPGEEAGQSELDPAGGISCGVLGIGYHSVGLAVGTPGERPSWIGSRPVGVSRLAERSRLSDPPEPAQLSAARSAAEKAFGGLARPPFDLLISVSDFSLAARVLSGKETVGPGMASDLVDSIAGMSADELAARTGLGKLLAPLFPLALVVQEAAARTFGVELVLVDPDPAGLGLALSDLSATGA